MATIDRYSRVGADIRVQRSRFPLTRRASYSYMHGYLHPVGTPIEVLPGDTFKAKLSVYVRMSTPIVPFIDDIRFEGDAFFVPKRILWNKTKQFYGEAPSFGIASPVYEPTRPVGSTVAGLNSNLLKCESIASAFGLILDDMSGTSDIEVNVLPIRGLLAIYNEFFRNENYQNQYTWDKDETGTATALAWFGGSTINGLNVLPQVNKDGDVVTSVLPYQIKGNPVTLGLAGNAPVVTGSVNTSLVNQPSPDIDNVWNLASGVTPLKFGVTSSDFGEGAINMLGMYSDNSASPSRGDIRAVDDEIQHTEEHAVAPINLWADLSQTTAVNISDLLYALAYQDFLARAAHFGTRFKEYIYGMFGTTIADATEDIPEYLGRLKFNINVNQVVQTTGFAPSASSSLGSLGAYSVSGDSKDLFTKSFTEPGYLIIVAYTKHRRTYSSGIDRIWLKKELLDYYQPPFANIADVPYDSSNIWFESEFSDITSLGFQEPFYDYRSLQDRTYGMMNPKIDTLGQIWTLGEKYSSKPTIGAEFMKEDRNAIARVLVTGVNGPDYLIDTILDIDATRVMPLYSSGKLGRF